MNSVVQNACRVWGFSGAKTELVAARENAVYRVHTDRQTYALRLHRKGYRSDAELCSELAWMDRVARGGLKVPKPVASPSGEMLHVVDGVQIDVLNWLDGQTVTEFLAEAVPSAQEALYHQIGRQMAQMHIVCDAWPIPEGFERCAWDRHGLLGESPLWDRFWCNPALSMNDRALFQTFRATADSLLAQCEDDLDYGLIHADLVGSNMLVHDGEVRFIDFDDGGFGYRLFDIATALGKLSSEAHFPMLKRGFLQGYTAVRPIALDHLDLFLAIRAATYVGWNISRMHEQGAIVRNDRFINEAREIIQRFQE